MIKFEEYEKMIYSRAKFVSEKYHADYDECVSIGYEIFVNAVPKFKNDKGAKFGTYLYIELNRIADEIKRQKRLTQYIGFDDVAIDADDDCTFEDIIESKETPDNNALLELAKNTLSFEAFRLLKWITSFSWQNWDKQRVASIPTKKMAIKGCGFPRDVIESAWAECESFWNKYAWKVA